jgi:hypothetical protein
LCPFRGNAEKSSGEIGKTQFFLKWANGQVLFGESARKHPVPCFVVKNVRKWIVLANFYWPNTTFCVFGLFFVRIEATKTFY